MKTTFKAFIILGLCSINKTYTTQQRILKIAQTTRRFISNKENQDKLLTKAAFSVGIVTPLYIMNKVFKDYRKNPLR